MQEVLYLSLSLSCRGNVCSAHEIKWIELIQVQLMLAESNCYYSLWMYKSRGGWNYRITYSLGSTNIMEREHTYLKPWFSLGDMSLFVSTCNVCIHVLFVVLYTHLNNWIWKSCVMSNVNLMKRMIGHTWYMMVSFLAFALWNEKQHNSRRSYWPLNTLETHTYPILGETKSGNNVDIARKSGRFSMQIPVERRKESLFLIVPDLSP